MAKRLYAALMAGIVIVALATGQLVARAAGSCSIIVPAKVYIGASLTTITARPGSDCAASGMQIAQWTVQPSNYGDSFLFEAGTISDSYTFYDDLDAVGTLRAVPAGASSSTGFNDIAQNTATFVVKYTTLLYASSSRSGAAVYVNGLMHRWSSSGLSDPSGAVMYLQRFINGGWQNMLARTTAGGHVTVGFVQRAVYQYRWVSTETSTAWSGRSASTVR